MKRIFNEIDEDEQPVRTGILKSALLANDENRPHGRRDKWTKEAYKELEEAEKRGRKYPTFFRKLDNEDVEQEERSYPYRNKSTKEEVFARTLKKRALPLLHTTIPSGLTLSLHQRVEIERNASYCGGNKQEVFVSPFLQQELVSDSKNN